MAHCSLLAEIFTIGGGRLSDITKWNEMVPTLSMLHDNFARNKVEVIQKQPRRPQSCDKYHINECKTILNHSHQNENEIFF